MLGLVCLTATLKIYLGSPWEIGYNECFNGTLSREVLNAEWFHTTKQAQVAINAWLLQYSQIRSHHALGMRPTVPDTLLEKTKISGTQKWGYTTFLITISLGSIHVD